MICAIDTKVGYRIWDLATNPDPNGAQRKDKQRNRRPPNPMPIPVIMVTCS